MNCTISNRKALFRVGACGPQKAFKPRRLLAMLRDFFFFFLGTDYSGRGELSERQQKLNQMVSFEGSMAPLHKLM